MKKASILYFLVFMIISLQALAQKDSITKKKFHWGKSDSDTTAGYAQAVLVDNIPIFRVLLVLVIWTWL